MKMKKTVWLLMCILAMLVTSPWPVPIRALAQEGPNAQQGPSQVGRWRPLTSQAPSVLGICILVPDGTVMCNEANGSARWFRLTPDARGSYANGAWTIMPPMTLDRDLYASQVLRDGRVFVAGGEFGSGSAAADIYQPRDNTWTQILQPGFNLYGATAQLPNGNVLTSPLSPNTNTQTWIFNIASGTLDPAPPPASWQNETGWVKLRDDSILTVGRDSTYSERFIPSLNQWVPDGTAPFLWSESETGPRLLLPNGKAFSLGANGVTGIYAPSGTIASGTWTTGAPIPEGRTAGDVGAAMLVNGKILAATGGASGVYIGPVKFFEYDYVSDTWTPVNSPTGGPTFDANPYHVTFLDLPDGTVLMHGFSPQAYVYKPAGNPLNAGRPRIINVTRNPNGSYHVTGTLFNGISEGSNYGDENQNASNYPIARLTDERGRVYYARTYNWSSTGVQTGRRIVSTQMALPFGLPRGEYSLSIIANGISSGSDEDDEGNFTIRVR